MKLLRLALIAISFPILAGTARAASVALSVVGGSNANLPKSFNLDDQRNSAIGWSLAAYQALVPAGVAYNGSPVKTINGAVKSAANGLFVNGPAKVTYTYLGYEASYTNVAVNLDGGSEFFKNKGTGATAFGATYTTKMSGPGFLEFAFSSKNLGQIDNNGGATFMPSWLKCQIGIAYSSLFNGGTSIIPLFDDSGASVDRDYDDLGVRIDVAPVPLPAAGLMLLAAMGGLGALSRRRKLAA